MAKKRRKTEEQPAAGLSSFAPRPFTPPATILSFLEKHARVIAIVAVLLASARIASTYTVFNETCDEPAHIACGMEWLDKGKYTCEVQHPPLARVAVALGPYLLGGHSEWSAKSDFDKITAEGIRILWAGNRYDLTLAMSRLGVLPFFWIACLVIYQWGRRYFSRSVAALAVCLFSFLPSVLAHAGLSTTDMAVTAMLGAAFLTMLMWLEQPTPAKAVLFGVCGSLAILSKFSALVFFPASVGLSLLWYLASGWSSVRKCLRDLRALSVTLVISALVCCLVIWIAYRFSFGSVTFASLKLPFPEFYAGIQSVSAHNGRGHISFLLGQIRQTGWWYFFLVVMAVKTPLAFLILLGVWIVMAWRKTLGFQRAWLPMTYALAILLVGLTSRINLGLRHILPVYVGASLMAAVAAVRLLERASDNRWLAIMLLVLFGWFTLSTVPIHPDYIAYFNELAGSHPENILAESDLDWGQDFKRLAKRLKELGAPDVTLVTYYQADFQKLGIPVRHSAELGVVYPPAGWSAVSISDWKVFRLGLMDRYPQVSLWPDRIPPTERIGKGILLWYTPLSATESKAR